MDPRTVVVKVGGSLLDWNELPSRLSQFLTELANPRIVLIVGGGRAADFVRELDRVHSLGDSPSHHLAIRALDLTAHGLASLLPGLVVVHRESELRRVWASGRRPVLAPRLMLERDARDSDDPLPHSWDVTTDAISARLAILLGASELILLKSTSVPEGADRHEAARLGLVDPSFPTISRALSRVRYRNLREPSGAILDL